MHTVPKEKKYIQQGIVITSHVLKRFQDFSLGKYWSAAAAAAAADVRKINSYIYEQ